MAVYCSSGNSEYSGNNFFVSCFNIFHNIPTSIKVSTVLGQNHASPPSNRGIGLHNCNHSDDVAVYCNTGNNFFLSCLKLIPQQSTLYNSLHLVSCSGLKPLHEALLCSFGALFGGSLKHFHVVTCDQWPAWQCSWLPLSYYLTYYEVQLAP